jgi:hypothetical protein
MVATHWEQHTIGHLCSRGSSSCWGVIWAEFLCGEHEMPQGWFGMAWHGLACRVPTPDPWGASSVGPFANAV